MRSLPKSPQRIHLEAKIRLEITKNQTFQLCLIDFGSDFCLQIDLLGGGGDSPPRPDQSRSECNEIYCKNMFLIRFQTQKLRKMFRNGLGTILDKTQIYFFMIFDQIFASILIHLWEFGETPRHSPANPARGVPKINRKITFLDCFQTQIHPQSVQERFRNDFRQS